MIGDARGAVASRGRCIAGGTRSVSIPVGEGMAVARLGLGLLNGRPSSCLLIPRREDRRLIVKSRRNKCLQSKVISVLRSGGQEVGLPMIFYSSSPTLVDPDGSGRAAEAECAPSGRRSLGAEDAKSRRGDAFRRRNDLRALRSYSLTGFSVRSSLSVGFMVVVEGVVDEEGTGGRLCALRSATRFSLTR